MENQQLPDSICKCERCERQIPMSQQQVREQVQINYCPACNADIANELDDLDRYAD